VGRHAATALAGALAALACAAPRARPEAPAAASPVPAAPAATGPAAAVPRGPAVRRGMSAAEVRAALGGPARVERVDSAAAPGSRYERWLYAGDREVVLLDGVVVDVLP
jgi:hypothetical protein